MALACLAIRLLIKASPLPPGTLHVGQELAFRRRVGVGEELLVSARVTSRGEKAGWVLVGVSFEVSGAADSPNMVYSLEGGQLVMTGRATITFPQGGTQPERF